MLLVSQEAASFRLDLIARGAIKACREQGFSFGWQVPSSLGQISFDAWRPSGMIVAWDWADVRKLARRKGNSLPIVSTIRGDTTTPLSSVEIDPGRVSDLLVEHLVQQQFSRFIFVRVAGRMFGRQMSDAFQERLAERLPRFDCRIFEVEIRHPFWPYDRHAGKRFLDLIEEVGRPLAVVTHTDQMAASCMECLTRAGLDIPRDVAVAAVGGHAVYTAMFSPLTTVEIDFEAFGRKAVEILARQISARSSGRKVRQENCALGGELIIRDSTAFRLTHEPGIARSLAFIREHFAGRVTLATLAGQAGMSRIHFAVRFKRAVGRSPMAFLNEHRLARARALLGETNASVSEVAHAVGFEFPEYFMRRFKARYGLRPGEYRREARLLKP